MNLADFRLSFWHPFGPHAQEGMEDIIARKQHEINRNGWTLWSFTYRPMLDAWHQKLKLTTGRVFAFCSEGKGAVDPVREGSASKTLECRHYRFVGNTEWLQMPSGIKVLHPFQPKGKRLASAFVVQRIILGDKRFPSPTAEWLSQEGKWLATRIPTRGVYLIRRGGNEPTRTVRAVLELKSPYLAVVKA